MHLNAVPVQERAETVPFVWPNESRVDDALNVESYSADTVMDREAFESVQDSIGWSVTEEQWLLISTEVIEGSMVVISQSEKPVAVACGLLRPDSWVELAWVAVAPAHRSLGIGKMVCGTVVRQLLSTGNSKIFGSTQDERLSAIKIYLDIGFYPLYRKEKVERWRSICQKLERPFTPSDWRWPSDA
jgi:mycothiol synthase